MKKSKGLTFPSLEAGHTIGGRYELVREIGRGPRGLVFEAKDRDFEDWPVALKVLPTEFAVKKGLLSKLRECAHNAIQIIHENIIMLHEVECIDGIAFIVMQLLEPFVGNDQGRMEKLPFAEVCHIAHSAVAGLSAAHCLGIFHGAIKPSNLMWSDDRILKLVEVGVLCNVCETKSPYVAPERLRGEAASALADQYSLAATLETLMDDAAPLHAKEALKRAKATIPEERFDDCDSFLTAFLGPNWSPAIAQSSKAANSQSTQLLADNAQSSHTEHQDSEASLYINDEEASNEGNEGPPISRPSIINTVFMLAILPFWMTTFEFSPLLTALGIVIMSIWVAIDAYERTSVIPQEVARRKRIWGTGSWFIGTMLLFPLVYPAYVLRRYSYADLQGG